MKQTAVEWLEEQIICQQNIYIDMAKKNKLLKKQVDAILTATTLLKMKCKQAKEMEKQQQGYSEEDMKLSYEAGKKRGNSGYSNTDNFRQPNFEEFIEQFKNK